MCAVTLLDDDYAQQRKQEESDGQANGDLVHRFFESAAGFIDGAITATKDTAQSARAFGLQLDYSDQRYRDNALNNVEIGFQNRNSPST